MGLGEICLITGISLEIYGSQRASPPLVAARSLPARGPYRPLDTRLRDAHRPTDQPGSAAPTDIHLDPEGPARALLDPKLSAER